MIDVLGPNPDSNPNKRPRGVGIVEAARFAVETLQGGDFATVPVALLKDGRGNRLSSNPDIDFIVKALEALGLPDGSLKTAAPIPTDFANHRFKMSLVDGDDSDWMSVADKMSLDALSAPPDPDMKMHINSASLSGAIDELWLVALNETTRTALSFTVVGSRGYDSFSDIISHRMLGIRVGDDGVPMLTRDAKVCRKYDEGEGDVLGDYTDSVEADAETVAAFCALSHFAFDYLGMD